MTKKILLITGDCGEDYEVKVPQQALMMLGYQVDVAAPDKKPGDILQLVVHDFRGLDTFTELAGHRIAVDVELSSIQEKDYEGVVIPGGRAPEYIRMYDDAIKLVQAFLIF